MSDKRFSISKAIRETLVSGVPTSGIEREWHFEQKREVERTPELFKMQASNPRDAGLYLPLDQILARDLASTPVSAGGALIGLATFGKSDLLTWSAVLRAGASVLSGLSSDGVLWQVGTLPVPHWLPEVGMAIPSDPVFAGFNVTPKRISGMLVVSRQLLAQQSGPELDRILIGDISRQLASYLDTACLYGTGAAGNQPLGLTGVAGVNAITIGSSGHAGFCAAEALIEAANVSMDSYGVLASPGTKEILRTTAAFVGGGISTWDLLRGPQGSPEIIDGRCFVGAWQMLTVCIWGKSVEILLDPFSLADVNKLKIKASMLCDVGVRLPSAFGITDTVAAAL